MSDILILNAKIVNESTITACDILVEGMFIKKIAPDLSHVYAKKIIDAKGKFLLPGIIDDQVHFREPGLTHKGDIYTESKAAVAGGITTYMEMPNTIPQTLTQKLLEEKYLLAKEKSLANYSFYMGASNDNIEEVLKTNPQNVCGVKVFMGSSTGNMLVDDEKVLESIFSKTKLLIATHCEDEQIIRANMKKAKEEYGEDVPIELHAQIRSEEACYQSSSRAVALAKKWKARLHVLHISTARELTLFENNIPLEEKKITAEVCIHHLWFNEKDYTTKGTRIKWNPAVKTESDRQAIFRAVLDNTIDVIATDHAPHTLEEKSNTYFKAPSGGPLVQHSLVAMLEFYLKNEITLERIVEKMCHHPAVAFKIEKRGFIREGYFADLVLVDLDAPWVVDRGNILAKCGWSPFEGDTFKARVTHTLVSGHLAYERGTFHEWKKGERITFLR